MRDLPAVSIVIPTLNEEKYIPVLLSSLRQVQVPIEIIVVDGGSVDKTAQVVKEAKELFSENSSLRFVASTKKGIALQRNVGADKATNDIIIFCDADIVAPSDEDFQEIVYDFENSNQVVATGRIVPLERGFTVSFIHTVAYLSQKLLHLTGKTYFGGAFLITRKSAFVSVGGFDENLHLSEDVDYSNRVAKLGASRLYKVPIKVSTRRFEKYGYRWIFGNPRMLYKLIRRGRLENEDKVFYPFGEY